MRPIVFAVASAVALAGCASTPTSSVSTPLSDEASAVMASDITGFVGTETKPTRGPIVVEQAAGDSAIWVALVQDLQEAGYTVADSASHKLTYEVSVLSDGTVLRVTFDHASAARMYHAIGGQLEPSGPFSVRDAGA
jgi:hypothetical protein